MELFHVLTQFDVPVGEVNEMLPTVMMVHGKVDLYERTPFGPFGLSDEVQGGLLGGAVCLLRIAFDAGADNVFPRGRAAAVARDDVVQVQILAFEDTPAILAGVLIALKNIVAGELDFLLGKAVINQEQDDARDADAKGNGAD